MQETERRPTDDGLCAWCSELNDGSTYYPYCSEACEIEAERAAADDEGDDEGDPPAALP